jgi:hypothetical protein
MELKEALEDFDNWSFEFEQKKTVGSKVEPMTDCEKVYTDG